MIPRKNEQVARNGKCAGASLSEIDPLIEAFGVYHHVRVYQFVELPFPTTFEIFKSFHLNGCKAFRRV